MVLGLETVDATTTVKLSAEDLICLNETLQFAGEVSILALQALRMLFKGLSLSRKVAIIRTVLVLCYPEALDIASHSEQTVFFFFQADLGVTDLNGDVSVATLLEVNLLSKIVIFLGNSLIISS